MQISRHWRMNAQRYRLEGVRYENDEKSLQPRHALKEQAVVERVEAVNLKEEKENAVNTAA